MSPGFSAATTRSASGPMQSVAKATGRPPSAWLSGATSGFSEKAGSGLPLGRPKCESTITLPPLLASSSSVGARRSMRVASVTWPSFMGTLRSTRTQHALAGGVDGRRGCGIWAWDCQRRY